MPLDRKCENEGGPGVERIAELLRNALPARESRRAVRRFADALMWNWLIVGTDAHAKNYSLLLAGDRVRLAPLYDVASALPYSDLHVCRLRFAMKLGGDSRVALWNNPWPRAARDLRLELCARADDLAERESDAFADAVREPQVTALARPLPATLADLVANRAGRCRKLLTRGAQPEVGTASCTDADTQIEHCVPATCSGQPRAHGVQFGVQTERDRGDLHAPSSKAESRIAPY